MDLVINILLFKCVSFFFPPLLGLSAPVPRGRKGKKAKRESKNFSAVIELEKDNMQMDPEIVLSDQSYKRHIERHSNK